MNTNNKQLQKQKCWLIMPDNCVTQETCPILTTNGEYIVFVGGHKSAYGLVMYDVKNATFPEILRFPALKKAKLYGAAIAYDAKQNVVYVWGGENHACFIIYDLNMKTCDIKVGQKTSKKMKREYNIKHVGYCCRAICDIQQKLHVIGGENCNTHMIYDSSQQLFTEVFAFGKKNVAGFGLVCDSINNRLILFGGCKTSAGFYKFFDDIWFFDISTHSWSECAFKLKTGVTSFGYLLLEEIQVILMFGGVVGNFSGSDNIWMLDINDGSCTEITHIKCPKETNFHAILVANTDENQSLFYIHLFNKRSTEHWCISLESILPLIYYESYCNLKNSIPVKIPSETKEENEKTYDEMKKEIFQYKNAVLELEKELEKAKKTISELMNESKEEEVEGNFNLKHMNKKELLNMREKSFKLYFYSVVVKMADKYYESFVENAFNDMEIVMEFARMEDKNKSLGILCNDCGMNEMHARQLLRKLSQLSLSNTEFEKWFITHKLVRYYQLIIDAGVATFAMFEDIFVCCTDFVEFLGEENEKQGIFIWRNLPLERNKNESESSIKLEEETSETQTNITSNIEEGEGQ